jgi:hypothetical protein
LAVFLKEAEMKSAKLVSELLLGLTLLASPAFAQRDVQRLNTEGIARAIGKQGDLTGEMYKVSFPRSDLTVNVGNVVIKPALALIAWAAFIKSGNNAVTGLCGGLDKTVLNGLFQHRRHRMLITQHSPR